MRETDDCILWPYAKSKGYGKFTVGGVRHYVHVHALERTVGPAPDGMVARHGPCHDPACFNPRHLMWGTRIQNQGDRRRDGTAPIGSAHPAAKLSESDVLEIRASDVPGVDLAHRYEVKVTTIYAVRRRQTWRHI